jgi:alkanesulfonate monooxygenase SsuD/methylene tetrahydromethanopterin reductase-like flavin-dependent oxidoreductase (luciferase family)
VRTAVSIPPFTDASTVVALAVEAEHAGWDGVFLWDHLVFSRDLRLDVHDPWVVLGAIAQATARVRLGTLVTPLARRRPWIVAKHLITLDHLSGGRAVLGVGLGEPPDADFGAFGDPVERKERAAIVDEALDLLGGLLRGPVAHDGAHFRVDAEILPRPVQEPRPPIWVAAIVPNRRPIVRAQRWDGIVPLGQRGYTSPDELAAYLKGVERPPGGTWWRAGRRGCPPRSTPPPAPPGSSTPSGPWATGWPISAAASPPVPEATTTALG